MTSRIEISDNNCSIFYNNQVSFLQEAERGVKVLSADIIKIHPQNLIQQLVHSHNLLQEYYCRS